MMGAVIDKATGNTCLGAIIDATVGGATGAILGHQMDKQVEEIEQTVFDAKAVSGYLVTKQIGATRVSIKGLG